MPYQLAQINIAKMKYPIDDDRMKDFVDNLDLVNANADQADGFIWRMQDESGNNTDTAEAETEFGTNYIVNMSVWENADLLKSFMMQEPHAAIMRRKKEWFIPSGNAYMTLWWIPTGHQPTIREAALRLKSLEDNGPTQSAFHFGKIFPAPL